MRRFLYQRICALGWALFFLLALSAGAQAQNCTVAMPAMAFGNVNVLPGTAVDTTTTLTVTCAGGSGNSPRRICISIGAGSANDATSRQMIAGANRGKYDLDSDSARPPLL